MVNGDRIRALRYAREVVDDLRWRGMTVPPIYTTMAEEFHALVRSGAYTACVGRRLRRGAALGRHGAYVGFLGDEGPARVHQAYPGPTWERLAEIKRRYDPANLFRLNQNVKPTG